MKIHTKMSQFQVKSQFKEWKYADGGHSLNWDFTVCTLSLQVTTTYGVVDVRHPHQPGMVKSGVVAGQTQIVALQGVVVDEPAWVNHVLIMSLR